MPRTRSLRFLASTATLLVAMAATGCDQLALFEELEEQSSLVQVFATHHATADDGLIPDRGADGQNRVFETDAGWTITLTRAYVVTTGVTLHRCDGTAQPIDLFWGPMAEDMLETDLDLFTLGSTELEPGTLCTVTVHYGPYDETSGSGDADADVADGATIYLHGIAEYTGTDGETDLGIPFEIRAEGELSVDIDISQIDDGKPLRMTGDEAFPVELTLSKTYDRFFDAIDLTDMASLDMDEHVLAVLAGVTAVDTGTRVAPR